MHKYPSIFEAKAHAKHIARTFNLKLTEAQEIVSYIYQCNDWAELKNKENAITNSTDLFAGDAFDYQPPKSELQKFDLLVSPHIEAIKKYIAKRICITGSLLERVASKNYSRISGQIINSVLEDCKEPTLESSELIYTLNYYDDTFNKVLNNERVTRAGTINTHLEPKCYRQKFYAYYRFNKKELYVLSTEWDLGIFRPTNATDKWTNEHIQSACNRNWFNDYMIGYLKLLTQQFRMAGYSGKLRICKIDNSSVSTFYHNKTDEYSNKNIDKLFEALLELGGKYAWDIGEDKRKCNLGIELPFSKNCSQWMIGESSL